MLFFLSASLWFAVRCSAFHLPCTRQSTVSLPSSPRAFFSGGRCPHRQLGAATDSAGDTEALDSNRNDDDDMPEAAQDLRLFVTQRCIQSFMYLLATCTHDLHTVGWLNDFIQPITINNYWDEDEDLKPGSEDSFRENDKRLGSKLLNYHGLSALNTTLFPTWDSFFTILLEQPDAVIMIKTPADVGRRVYSEIDIDIEPARLCTRILSVREQIAKEMTGDLKAIANMGQLIFNSYWENTKERRDTKKQTKEGNGLGTVENEESKPVGFQHPSSMYTTFDPTDDAALAPSPLRKGNFDLLYSLITQSAILQLLESEDGVVVGEDVVQNRASQLFLSQFYKDRLLSHFVGSQWYGKGDDFIEELMFGSPIMMPRHECKDRDKGDEGEEEIEESEISKTPPLVVEPMRIAEQILLRRDKLALEWMDIMKAVPSEHTDIRKFQLDRLTGVVKTEPVKIVLEDEFQ